METKNLMSPRFEVIANYPNNPYKKGDLIVFSIHGGTVHLTTTNSRDDFDEPTSLEHFYPVEEIGFYPSLFKKLQWWEKRKENEMPAFIKSEVTQKIYKVEEYQVFGFEPLFGNYIPYSHCIPSTRQDYLNQENAKSNETNTNFI